MAECGGTSVQGKDVLAPTKAIEKDWKGDCVTKPKLELQHSDSSEHVPFETFLAQCLKECGVCKLMFVQKKTFPNEVNPSSKWEPRRGLTMSANMPTGKENAKNQHDTFAMEALEMILFGGAAGTTAGGRSLVGIHMQTHEGGAASFKVKRLSDTLEIVFRGHARKPMAPIGVFKCRWSFWRTRKTNKKLTRSAEESLSSGQMWTLSDMGRKSMLKWATHGETSTKSHCTAS